MKTFQHIKTNYEIPILNRIDNEGNRVYELNGDLFPSITTILSWSKQESLTNWRNKIGNIEADKIMKRAAQTGTDTHNIVEKYLLNEERNTFYKNTFPNIKKSFLLLKPFLDNIDNILHIEQPLFSKKLKIAGTVDCIAEYNGVPSIIDFKTSNKIKKESYITSYFQQETAYSIMYEELTGNRINQIVTIMSVESENTVLLFIKNRKDYIESLFKLIKDYRKTVLEKKICT